MGEPEFVGMGVVEGDAVFLEKDFIGAGGSGGAEGVCYDEEVGEFVNVAVWDELEHGIPPMRICHSFWLMTDNGTNGR